MFHSLAACSFAGYLSYFPILKMDAVGSSETSVIWRTAGATYQKRPLSVYVPINSLMSEQTRLKRNENSPG
jgi:hypothetical protein